MAHGTKFIICLFSFLFLTVFSYDDIFREANNRVKGIQEELQLLKGTVQTLVNIINVLTKNVDGNTNSIKNLTDHVTSITKKVDNQEKNMDSFAKKLDSTAIKTDLTAKKMHSTNVKVDLTSKKLNSTNSRVNSMDKNIDSNSKIIKKLSTEVAPLTEQCHALPVNVCGSCICRDDNRLLKKYYCDCANHPPKRDCKQFLKEGFSVDGIYRIHQNKVRIIKVYCDQTTDGGGWTVFQRRMDGSVKFYRGWVSYKNGFGDLQHEFWLGNANLFTLSLQGMYPSGNELRIDLMDWNDKWKTAKYSTFEISNEAKKFQLTINGYLGTAGDSFSYHNKMTFSTFDWDNDRSSVNCAVNYFGGWWYNNCHTANLNGMYYDGHQWQHNKGVIWTKFGGIDYSLKQVEMKVRRKD